MKQGSGKQFIDRTSATCALDAQVSQLSGVSTARRNALAKLGIRTLRDLLNHFPRRYIDMSQVGTIATANIGSMLTLVGRIHDIKLKQPKPRLSLVEITLVDESSTMIVTCFRQPWLMKKLQAGMLVSISGKVEFNFGFKRMTNPLIDVLDEHHAQTQGIVLAVYPASETMPVTLLRRLMELALERCVGCEDPLPLDLRVRYRLPSRQCALRCIHQPHNMTEVAQARRRLAYEELLLLELHLMMSAQAAQKEGAVIHCVDGEHLNRFRSMLPFKLTGEQQAACRDILANMAAPRAMEHMLLGDVGTGKTVVAAHALCAVADSESQALMMAPTEVLARQYAEQIGSMLSSAGVTWAVLTGSTPAGEREEIIKALGAGDIDVLFGTHALLEDDVRPARCSLVVIDEQQRFGVDQRAALIDKGLAPDVLIMTATPIPRTLALALYGSATLSYLTQRPRNHQGNTTRVLNRSNQGQAYDVALAALARGQQVYVVCPLVGQHTTKEKSSKKREDAEDSYEYGMILIEDDSQDNTGVDSLKAAQSHASFLQSKVFVDYQVELLHGRMSGEEKQEVMKRFYEGQSQVLVATTVIEVGVNVPNATVMIIEDAERFGLAQLHQLRGRVGRGDTPGAVFLISGSKAPAALERLAVMERTEDGLEVAEYDLSLRREGDILGNRQHGASSLKLVNVVRDKAIVEVAHSDAQRILENDPKLSLPQHRLLAHELSLQFSDRAGRD